VTARNILLDKIDLHLNGNNSVKNQIKRIEEERGKTLKAKQAKKRELKAKFKEELQRIKNKTSEAQEIEIDALDSSEEDQLKVSYS
jgi:hypothetical protein